MLPLTVAHCALVAPLAAEVARLLGYRRASRGAVGLGLAAFLGAGLLARNFLSGATLNLIAWQLVPVDQRLAWGAWALAAGPATLVMAGGALAVVLVFFRPVAEPGDSAADTRAVLPALGPIPRASGLRASSSARRWPRSSPTRSSAGRAVGGLWRRLRAAGPGRGRQG